MDGEEAIRAVACEESLEDFCYGIVMKFLAMGVALCEVTCG